MIKMVAALRSNNKRVKVVFYKFIFLENKVYYLGTTIFSFDRNI